MGGPKRVAAVHDLSGFGRCSLTIALPVLASMGAQCYPLLTAYLSAHTGFPASEHAVFRDFTPEMAQTAAHWRELGAEFDAIYSGFLGSLPQIELLNGFLDDFAAPLVLIDPVMGDHGKVYRTYTPEMCRAMTTLAARADVITPNLTEAALLLGEPYDSEPSEGKAHEWLARLSLDGRRAVVITGLRRGNLLGAACRDWDGTVSVYMEPEVPGRFSGTGDLFASVLLGGLLRGASLAEATENAVQFVRACAEHTTLVGGNPAHGVLFEGLLRRLL